MFLSFIIFILVFLIVFFVIFFCLVKKTLVINNLYLIIPAICIGLWAFYFLLLEIQINKKFIITQYDFKIIYYCGKQVWIDPTELYKLPFYYLPIWAVVLAVTVCLFPYYTAAYIFFITTIFLGILSIREYNKILFLMDVKKKIHRFMFLIIISNGFTIYRIFVFGQFKYIILIIFLFVIRREIQFRKNDKKKDLKFNLLNFSLFAFAVAIFPFFIFLLLIYVFQDIPRNEIFKKENVKKYGIVLLVFTVENFLFFIYPSLILDFLGLFGKFNKSCLSHRQLPLFYIVWINLNDYSIFFLISTIIVAIITLILIFFNNKQLQIEEKFAYFSLACIFISMYARRLFLILFPLVFLLFIPFLNQDERGIDFFKKNKIFLVGLLSGFLIYSMDPHDQIIEFFFPYLEGSIFIELRWIVIVGIFGWSLLKLHMKNIKFKHN